MAVPFEEDIADPGLGSVGRSLAITTPAPVLIFICASVFAPMVCVFLFAVALLISVTGTRLL